MSSGRLQQSPVPDKGGIFERQWWQPWEPQDGKFPPLEYIIASLDSAFTEKQQNDPSGFTIWGTFRKDGKRRVILVHAWRKHLAFSGPRNPQGTREPYAQWKQRTSHQWGLIEHVVDSCLRFKVDKLLIEAKSSGISAGQAIQRTWGVRDFAIQLCPVKGDKVARALGVQPVFSQEYIYAPKRDWAEMVIDEAAMFPKGRYDDLVDSMTLALKYLKDVGMLQEDALAEAEEREKILHKPSRVALYPC
jgi:predicted phage terminase large subunit-like protein